MKNVAVVSGASSGIGKATALYLIDKGYIVFGVSRRLNEMSDLIEAGGKALAMDVTDSEQIRDALQKIMLEEERIDVLVNCAGFAVYGAIEDVSIEAAKRQFEVNLFGLAQLTKMILPIMRKQKSGTIVNVSSVGGKIHSPLGAWYHASKHALEGWSDCLRVEVKQFGIKVVIVEPGTIKTEFGDVRNRNFSCPDDSPYLTLAAAMKEIISEGYKPGNFSEPEEVATVIFKSINAINPKTRYTVGKKSASVILYRKICSDRFIDKTILNLVRKLSGK